LRRLLLRLLRLRGCWLRLRLLRLHLWLLLRLGRLQLVLHRGLHLRGRLHLLQLLHEGHGRRRQLGHHIGRILLPCFQIHDPLLCEQQC
jgi:hypothetical protein